MCTPTVGLVVTNKVLRKNKLRRAEVDAGWCGSRRGCGRLGLETQAYNEHPGFRNQQLTKAYDRAGLIPSWASNLQPMVVVRLQ